jgi:hypothetical protein
MTSSGLRRVPSSKELADHIPLAEELAKRSSGHLAGYATLDGIDGGDHLYGETGSDLLADDAFSEYCDLACQFSDDANDSRFGGPGATSS